MANSYHDELTDCYYNNKPFRGKILTGEEFEKLHALNWLKEERKQVVEGKGFEVKAPRALAEIDAQIAALEK